VTSEEEGKRIFDPYGKMTLCGDPCGNQAGIRTVLKEHGDFECNFRLCGDNPPICSGWLALQEESCRALSRGAVVFPFP
jgi:hypothetical protein